jgi:Mrp family chromosome partitioning ATPase
MDFLVPKLVGKDGVNDSVMFINPYEDLAEFEAFRKLAINLEFAHPEKKFKVIYITSSGPDEGKTFITLNLAHVQSYSNKKTIIIDTDFRKKHGSVTDVTDMRKKPGLFDVLKGELTLDKAINDYVSVPSKAHRAKGEAKESGDSMHSAPGTMRILPVGKIPVNPFTFLDSDNMRKLITDLKDQYDYVLIDGVPLIIFADASYLANFADGVILTARYDHTGIRELEYSQEMLNTAKAQVIGIVMNGISKTQNGYYYNHYTHYQKYYNTRKNL